MRKRKKVQNDDHPDSITSNNLNNHSDDVTTTTTTSCISQNNDTTTSMTTNYANSHGSHGAHGSSLESDDDQRVKVYFDLRLNGNDRNAIVYGIMLPSKVLLSELVALGTRYILREFGLGSHLHRLSRIQLDSCDVLVYETLRDEKSFVQVPLREGEHLVLDALRITIKEEPR